MRLLDLYCGAGGASAGYHHAGYDITGVDTAPQPRYPYPFIRGNALTIPLDGYDLIHASPPCQAYTTAAPGRKHPGHPDLLAATRTRLQAAGIPYVIENVPGAPMRPAVVLCGTQFALPVARHRLFETWPRPGLLTLAAAASLPRTCPQASYRRTVPHKGVYPYGHGHWYENWRDHVLPVIWPWMTIEESGQAIPPAYTAWIGRQLAPAL